MCTASSMQTYVYRYVYESHLVGVVVGSVHVGRQGHAAEVLQHRGEVPQPLPTLPPAHHRHRVTGQDSMDEPWRPWPNKVIE